jgi:Maltokinase N-terminal cap domain
MALFHAATITPTKAELIAKWAPTRPWGPPAAEPVEVIGSYRFDDPDGRVGMETHLVRAGDGLLQVPLTYRDEPLDGADDALITEMEHSVLGTRWVYDGLRDPVLVTMLAAVTMTGQGEALGMVEYDGRWHIAPSPVRIQGGGWNQERVPVDGFELVSGDDPVAVLRNDRFELTAYRRPEPGPRPAIGLTATGDGLPGTVVLAAVRER